MAYTCRDVVKAAFRKLGVVGTGREPSSSQGDDGLLSLQSLYEELIANGGFGQQFDVTTSSDMVASPGQRIQRTTNTPVPVITLPTLTTAGWTPGSDSGWIFDYGFIRCSPQLLDMALVTITNSYDAVTEQWLYDASTGKWINLLALALSDTAPLATRGLDGLASMLAVRIAPMFSDRPVSAIVLRSAAIFQNSIMTRPGTYRPAAVGSYM